MNRNLAWTSAALLLVSVFGMLSYTAPAIGSVSDSLPQGAQASTVFDKQCATCHGKDGQAKTFKAKLNHARNLTDPDWQGQVTDERISNSISNGKGKMPAFGKKLSEAEISALVGYVRTLKK